MICQWEGGGFLLRFNEAAGIHRRKPVDVVYDGPYTAAASMRPPEFTGGNARRDGGVCACPAAASMRPPEFTGGNAFLLSMALY